MKSKHYSIKIVPISTIYFVYWRVIFSLIHIFPFGGCIVRHIIFLNDGNKMILLQTFLSILNIKLLFYFIRLLLVPNCILDEIEITKFYIIISNALFIVQAQNYTFCSSY